MKITLDQNLCIGCGTCESLCPSHFKVNASGKAEVISQEDAPCVAEAVSGCCVGAIKVVND